jgi:hypothetical protein
MTDKSQVRSYKATARKRRDVLMPFLSRGDLSASSLSEKDYVPVLRANIPTSCASVGDREAIVPNETEAIATQIPTTEASSRRSNNKSKKARISNTSSSNRNDGNSSSGRPKAQSDVHETNAYETDVNDYTTDKEMSYRDLVLCNVCNEAIYRSITQGPAKTCSICSFSFHNKCSDGGSNVSKESAPSSSSSSSSASAISASPNARASASVGASPNASDSASSNGWVCKICNMMSMINDTAEGNNDELSQFFVHPGTVDGYPSADNVSKVGSKRGRHVFVYT